MSPRGCNLKSLASKPASPRKCPVLGSRTLQKCPVLDSTIFRFVKNGPRSWPFFSSCWSKPETSRKISDDLFFGVHLNFVKNLRFFLSDDLFFWRTLAHCVLGLEKVRSQKIGPSPWIFFVSLAFALSLVSSTPPLPGLTIQNLTQ